ncbi:MAG TPA: SurA N-terminal domain-containing protein, partial [Pseudacidobacterium sp.]|nr:SurA N-terminal domain-containing protein [Pseudacidobacterium sp.]
MLLRVLTVPRNSSAFLPRFQQMAMVCVASLAMAGAAGCHRTHGPDVVATVNGKPIMRSEVEQLYQNNLGDSQQQPSKEQADIVRLNIIRQLIDEEILMQRAAKLNLTATDEEVDNQLNELKAPFTQEEFNKRLADKHLTLDDLKRQIRRSKTEDKLLNKEINSKINITDADISSYYNAHKSEFNLIEPMYHLAQIIVTSQPLPQQQQTSNLQNSKATNDAEAKKKIEMLHNRLESGEDFGLLAQNFSERPDTASNGGDMGFV